MDPVPVEKVLEAESAILEKVKAEWGDLENAIERAEKDDAIWEQLVTRMETVLNTFKPQKEENADTGSLEPEDQDGPRPAGSGQDHEKPGRV